VNRVLAAMQQLGLERIISESQARAVLEMLGADAILVGTVTGYDPYPPLALGMALELYSREPSGGGPEIDPATFARTTRGDVAPGTVSDVSAVARAAGTFSGRDHQTLIWLHEYAQSRHEPDSAYGGGIYLVSMDLFTQFVGHVLVRDLLGSEQVRLGTAALKETGH
jgi:hypothetical protein